MASGFTIDQLTSLTTPTQTDDVQIIGRGAQSFKAPLTTPLPIPILVGLTDQGPDQERCMISDDPLVWWELARMPRYANGSASVWKDLVYASSLKQLFAVAGLNNGGNKNTIAASRDGRQWAGRGDDATAANNGIAWAPSIPLLCVVGSSGTTTSNRVRTSPDGFTWTERALPTINIALNSVAWSPSLALFCAVGDSNTIFTSPDGITWTSRTGPTGGIGSFRRIIWAGGSFNKFVAFDGNRVGISSDGISWGASVSVLGGNGRGLAFSPSLGVIVVTDANTNNFISHSTNGTSWTNHTVTGSWHDVAWSARLALFIAVSNYRIATSPDGSTWTRYDQTPVAAAFSNWVRLIATQ
jgi:hypothetical protein